MKFPQLPIGQRFSFQGKAYTKTGPMTASEEATGKRQLIRKSAAVTPLDARQEATTQTGERQFSESEVREMFDGYREQLRVLLVARLSEQDPQLLEQLLASIEVHPLPID